MVRAAALIGVKPDVIQKLGFYDSGDAWVVLVDGRRFDLRASAMKGEVGSEHGSG